MKVTLIASIVSNYLTLARINLKQCDLGWRPPTSLSAHCVVPKVLIWSGCLTNARGSSCAPPSHVRTASRKWSFQSCSSHGAQNSSAVTSRNDLKLGQLEQVLTAHDHCLRRSNVLLWASQAHELTKTKPKSVASALAPDDLGLQVVVNVWCVTKKLSWWSQPNCWLEFCRCCSKYVKTLLSQVVLKLVPAVGKLSIGSPKNSKSNPSNINSGGCWWKELLPLLALWLGSGRMGLIHSIAIVSAETT